MEYKYILSQIVKFIFLDKYINRIFGEDLGIIQLKNNYIVDIPKSGSTTIKNLVARRSKRYNFCKKYLKIKPKHPSVRPIKKVNPVNGEIKIFVFIRPPEERLYSLYNQKVLNYKNFPLGFSIIKKEKFYLAKRFNANTKYSKDNTFLEFCNGITKLKSEFLDKGYQLDLFDKHLLPQSEIILNLKKSYNNFNEFKFIIYPIDKLNDILGSFLGKRVRRKFNITKKDQNKNYLKDISISRINEILYKKDKLLYDNLINSPEGFLEYSYSFLKDFSE